MLRYCITCSDHESSPESLRKGLKKLPCRQVTEIMVPLVKFYFHEEVRKAAVSGESSCTVACTYAGARVDLFAFRS